MWSAGYNETLWSVELRMVLCHNITSEEDGRYRIWFFSMLYIYVSSATVTID